MICLVCGIAVRWDGGVWVNQHNPAVCDFRTTHDAVNENMTGLAGWVHDDTPDIEHDALVFAEQLAIVT